jgi:serine/threonine-protein kinase
MTRKRDRSRETPAPAAAEPAPPEPAPAPSPASLAALAALGTLSALWALFLWAELLVSRTGGTPFCALGGQADCAAVWNSAFASAVHRLTGLPIAGWGLAWGLVAGGLALLGLLRGAQGRPDGALTSAIRLTAAAGLLTVFVMVAVAVGERAFCLGCVVTYFLVAGYAGIALLGWPGLGLPTPSRGLAWAVGTTALAFAVLLYPGLRTPKGAAASGREALQSLPPASPSSSGGEETGDGGRDAQVRELIASLSTEARQTFSDSLHIYRSQPPRTPIPARSLDGPESAPVRITDFTDVRCDHCKELHETLASLREKLPPASFSVDSRHFPLDGECNPGVQAARDPVRCLAARARICLEGHAEARAFAALLFAEQKTLTRDRVFAIAAPHLPRREMEACVASPVTAEKLREDLAIASRYDPDGTPIVLVNGRQATSFAPFLYAMVLTYGRADHPAFASLPPPNPSAHLH